MSNFKALLESLTLALCWMMDACIVLVVRLPSYLLNMQLLGDNIMTVFINKLIFGINFNFIFLCCVYTCTFEFLPMKVKSY